MLSERVDVSDSRQIEFRKSVAQSFFSLWLYAILSSAQIFTYYARPEESRNISFVTARDIIYRRSECRRIIKHSCGLHG